MTCLRRAALAVALGIAALGLAVLGSWCAPDRALAQGVELRLAPPEAPAAYRSANLVREEPPESALPQATAGTPSPVVDVGARVRDELLGGLLGYGIGAGLGWLLGLIDAAGDDLQQPLLVALLAPAGVATGVWLGGELNGGSRFDGAMIGTTIGALIAGGMILLCGGPSLEEPATISFGLLGPVIGAAFGAELATAISGARF